MVRLLGKGRGIGDDNKNTTYSLGEENVASKLPGMSQCAENIVDQSSLLDAVTEGGMVFSTHDERETQVYDAVPYRTRTSPQYFAFEGNKQARCKVK